MQYPLEPFRTLAGDVAMAMPVEAERMSGVVQHFGDAFQMLVHFHLVFLLGQRHDPEQVDRMGGQVETVEQGGIFAQRVGRRRK